jgi:hypothetical protein
MNRIQLTAFGCLLLPLAAVVSSFAATYDVGLPGAALQKLADVPWAGLKPGDIVNLNAKPGG